MAECRSEALLLRRIAYGDTSLICHFMTASHGRMALMVRGARSQKSPFRATLAPLHQLQLRWRPGRTGMGILLESSRGQALLPETRMLEGLELLAVAAGLYREGDPHGYEEVAMVLQRLATGHIPESLHAAVWHLLQLCGWVGNMDECWKCNAPVAAQRSMYWHAGRLICHHCGGGHEISVAFCARMRDVLHQQPVRMRPAEHALWKHMISSVLQQHHIRLSGCYQ